MHGIFTTDLINHCWDLEGVFDFTHNVQIATDMVKGGAARLAGLEPPKYDDNEHDDC